MQNVKNNEVNYFSSADTVNSGIYADITQWKKEIENANLNVQFMYLRKTDIWLGIFLFIFDWAIIFLSFAICSYNPPLLPISLIVSGSRVRGLSNLIHDSSHFNLSRNSKINDTITNILAGWLLLTPVAIYRVSHFKHHIYLGNEKLDPDVQAHIRYGYNDLNPPYNNWLKNLVFLILNKKSWSDSTCGNWHEMNFKDQLYAGLLWTVLLSCLTLISIKASLSFLLFFICVRMTSYHIIRVCAEFIDHSGLAVGSITSNTRLIESANFMVRFLIHPHNDHLHALHHFDSLIPCAHLSKADKLVANIIPTYAAIRKNNGYIFGSQPALKDLGGK